MHASKGFATLLMTFLLTTAAACRSGKSPAEPKSPADADVVSLGMSINEAYKLFEKHKITPKLDDGAIAYPDNQKGMTLLVTSDHSSDALVLSGWAKPGVLMLIKDMYWYPDWKTDTQRPKGQRQVIPQRVNSVSIGEIQRRLKM